MFSLVLNKLLRREDLTESEMADVMNCIMDGQATPSQIGAFLVALRSKGESVEEITGSAKVMREKALPVELGGRYAIDTCGTGGDGAQTFNISTAVAFVAAAAGVTVVKHGNRSVSSSCGSADVLEALGVNIHLSPTMVERCVDVTNLGFMFAPHFHQAMKHVLMPRKELGVRTIFNVLGPLTNPAKVQGQVLGVFALELTDVMATALSDLGVKRAMVVHGHDGLDEITLTTTTKVSELRDGKVTSYILDPLNYGFTLCKRHDIQGGDSPENARIIEEILQGASGAKRDILILNAAAAIYVGKQASTLTEGIQLATATIDSGLAWEKLQQLKVVSQGLRAS